MARCPIETKVLEENAVDSLDSIYNIFIKYTKLWYSAGG
jgi:hypothetical protein